LTGVALPVFSIRSELSCGVGEFPDLVLLGQWCRRTGLDLIQILPVNDTGDDPSPYNARSAFALNPIYIRLNDVPGASVYEEEIVDARARFEAAGKLQYENVRNFKLGILRRIFRFTESAVARDEQFRHWVSQNPWLNSYSEFLAQEDKDSAVFVAWVQFHLDRQLRNAALELDAMGVALKGDIPILLSPESVDVQSNPSFFNKKLRVGAPPDMFSKEGQNWRFPSFRWDEMEKDEFAWWRSRLQRASRFYHAFRIDHVLGFFRMWSIPEEHESAAHGYYKPARGISHEALSVKAGISALDLEDLIQSQALIGTESGFAPAWYWQHSSAISRLDELKRFRLFELIEQYWTGQEDLWREHGRKLLTAIARSSDMLVCAEDLGVVPPCVPEVLQELDILGLRVERWSGINGSVSEVEDFPKLTVNTTSTHDSSTLRGWWQEHGWNREEYFRTLNLPGPCPAYLTTEVCAAILERNLNANSMIVVLPLQDFLALHYDLRTLEPSAERINVPGVESPENWTYRMKVSIESLLAYDVFNDRLKELVAKRRTREQATLTDAAAR